MRSNDGSIGLRIWIWSGLLVMCSNFLIFGLEKEEEGVQLGIYSFIGYFQEIEGRGGEYYGGLGVFVDLSENWRISIGSFFDYISGGGVFLKESLDKEYFVGLDFGLIYSPFGHGFLYPYIGLRQAITIYKTLYIRSSAVIGILVLNLEGFKMGLDYSMGYVAGSGLVRGFFSHLVGLSFLIDL